MDPVTFQHRRAVCSSCEFWRGSCVKGHPIRSNVGCPLKKFAPMPGFGYMLVRDSKPPDATPCATCGTRSDDAVEPTWQDVLVELGTAVLRWIASGMKMVPSAEHEARYAECKTGPCPSFGKYRCRECGCFAYVKAKLASEQCPRGRWRS